MDQRDFTDCDSCRPVSIKAFQKELHGSPERCWWRRTGLHTSFIIVQLIEVSLWQKYLVNERTNLCLLHGVKHRVRDANWSFRDRWLWRLSSVSITEDWALFVRRTFNFLIPDKRILRHIVRPKLQFLTKMTFWSLHTVQSQTDRLVKTVWKNSVRKLVKNSTKVALLHWFVQKIGRFSNYVLRSFSRIDLRSG